MTFITNCKQGRTLKSIMNIWTKTLNLGEIVLYFKIFIHYKVIWGKTNESLVKLKWILRFSYRENKLKNSPVEVTLRLTDCFWGKLVHFLKECSPSGPLSTEHCPTSRTMWEQIGFHRLLTEIRKKQEHNDGGRGLSVELGGTVWNLHNT